MLKTFREGQLVSLATDDGDVDGSGGPRREPREGRGRRGGGRRSGVPDRAPEVAEAARRARAGRRGVAARDPSRRGPGPRRGGWRFRPWPAGSHPRGRAPPDGPIAAVDARRGARSGERRASRRRSTSPSTATRCRCTPRRSSATNVVAVDAGRRDHARAATSRASRRSATPGTTPPRRWTAPSSWCSSARRTAPSRWPPRPAPHLTDGMAVLVCPGSCAGAIAFKRAAGLELDDERSSSARPARCRTRCGSPSRA